MDDDTFEISFGIPRFSGDTALVSVTVFTRIAEKDAPLVMVFERYVYRATRMSAVAWRATARYLDATGHYEFAKPPRPGDPASRLRAEGRKLGPLRTPAVAGRSAPEMAPHPRQEVAPLPPQFGDDARLQ